eukprot:TRINITY_DN3974_c0_g1_i1.p1 TRINITY_DN3974_c0_g1~~TRINITY_DN3974_c0_g1_i1.p1  ORF type:complete len:215 (-),score=50.12 TRINITY_DN3974_c0_g1_i1:40-684(-)
MSYLYSDLQRLIVQILVNEKETGKHAVKARMIKRTKYWKNLRLVCKSWKGMADSMFKFYYEWFYRAIRLNNVEAVRFLLGKRGISLWIKKKRHWAVVVAASRGAADVLSVLLKEPDSDPNVSDGLALRLACKKGRLRSVEVLLRDARIKMDQSMAEIAWEFNSKTAVQVVKLLLGDPRMEVKGEDRLRLLSKKTPHLTREEMEKIQRIANLLKK